MPTDGTNGSFEVLVTNVRLLHVVQIGFEVHPTSYPMGIGGSFTGVKSCRGLLLTTRSNYVPRSRNVSLPNTSFAASCLTKTKHRANFYHFFIISYTMTRKRKFVACNYVKLHITKLPYLRKNIFFHLL